MVTSADADSAPEASGKMDRPLAVTSAAKSWPGEIAGNPVDRALDHSAEFLRLRRPRRRTCACTDEVLCRFGWYGGDGTVL